MGRLRWQGLIILTLTGLVFASQRIHMGPIVTFVLAAVATVLLARMIGLATESLAVVIGPSLGALLGATFGNSVELIIAIVALRDGLYTVVKASVLGSVLANLLLTLGICMMVGGVKRHVQQFSRAKAGLNSVMLFVAVIGLTITSIYSFVKPAVNHSESLSVGVAVVFLLVYVLGFVFSLFTHRAFLAPADVEQSEDARWRPITAVAVLFAATVFVAYLSEQLVSTVQPLAAMAGLSQQFIGLVFIPLIGTTPELFVAIMLARKNQMDGSVEIAVGSSLQIALFVAPILVLIGAALHHPLTLVFSATEVVVIFLSTMLVSLVSLDGETHWFEGIMVTATYVIFAMLFFFQ